MKPLGIDLAKMAAGAVPVDDAPACPGGVVRVMRHDIAEMRRTGEVFQTSGDAIPADGYGSMRVVCHNACERLEKTASGHVMYYGLCRSCSQLEDDNRQMLRERAKAKGDR